MSMSLPTLSSNETSNPSHQVATDRNRILGRFALLRHPKFRDSHGSLDYPNCSSSATDAGLFRSTVAFVGGRVERKEKGKFGFLVNKLSILT